MLYFTGRYFVRAVCPICRYGDQLRKASMEEHQATIYAAYQIECQLCHLPISERQLPAQGML